MTRTRTVVAVLREQHRQIRRAVIRAAQSGRGWCRAFGELVRLLSIHEAAGETHIHPAARRAGRATAAAARVGEEERAKQLLRCGRTW